MNVLVIGGGGREHAICWSLLKSPRIGKLYCAPGNAGIAQIAKCVDISATDIDNIVRFAEKNVDLVVVAPDNPLALGLVNELESAGIRAFGPRKEAAIIESSKVFAKELMTKYGIPTARYEVFTNSIEAKAYIRDKGTPAVIKADGLAFGKGVFVASNIGSADNAINLIMHEKKFGESGSRIIIEEFMTGPEVTVLAFTDGKTIVPMLSSQDYKRAYTGDLGANTGGMGAFCPSPYYSEEIADTCMEKIFRPTIDAMRIEGRMFKGVIYFGLMLTQQGPRVVEYNARFGDPETQPILSLLKTDLLDIFEAIVDERLDKIAIEWKYGSACCVVMASGGYPERFGKGYEITGLDQVPGDITVFHAGTARSEDSFVTNGGRVLGITATGNSLAIAAARAYVGVRFIDFYLAHYRSDIGHIIG
ncbi:MAG: phosphoribosylamine--glycine ligase [Oscillospiraceae bacterium]|nr:phosphoribosylamine--glycine ligase [Oscillospiraceae bacterium]